MTESRDEKNGRPSGLLPANALVGHYRIISALASGGMGEIYLALDTKLNRKVALKFMSKAFLSEPDFRRLFMQEARAAAALNHPNIITIYEVGELEGRPFMAMEYVVEKSPNVFAHTETLELEALIEIALQICAGLNAAHAAGLVHRDIKLQNLLMGDDGRVRILDFGLAMLKGAWANEHAGLMSGTISYMSPEQVKGEAVDQRSDIFSLGVVLYELLTKTLPFHGEYEASILYAIVYQAPAPITAYNAKLPLAFQRIVQKALEKAPSCRYQSVAELAADLRLLKESLRAGHLRMNVEATMPVPSIAVMQFTDLSPNKDQEYFCDGVAEEIISVLTKIEGLRVAARTSTFQLKGQDADVRRIGQLLGVDTVLEGSVRKSGEKLRITTQLVNVADGYYLWSEKYDREMADLFAIQDEIARAIAERLKVRLGVGADKPLVKRYTDNLEAYNLYLQGRYFWNRRYEGGLQKSIQYYQKAIELDPSYALAYAGLADSYNILAFYNIVSPHTAGPKAKSAAIKALELDLNLAEAHTALGWVKTFYDWDWQGADEEFRKALELDDNYAITHHYYGLHLIALGRFEEGLAEMRRGLELDPLATIISTSLGAGLYFARRQPESIEQHLKALEFDPHFAIAHAFLAGPYVVLSRFAEAISECEKARALAGGSNYPTAFLAFAHGVAGNKAKSQELLEQLLTRSQTEYISSYHIALAYCGLREIDQALEWLEKAYVERDNWMVWLKVYPVFDILRSDPRFDSLLAKVGLQP